MSLRYFELQAITNGRQSNLNKQFPFNLFSLSSRKEILIEFHFIEDMFNKEYVGAKVMWGHPSTRNEFERDCVRVNFKYLHWGTCYESTLPYFLIKCLPWNKPAFLIMPAAVTLVCR